MTEEKKEQVVLLVGSCGLDRLLTVAQYPEPDAKVRTTAYNEVGGGNAANTASAMGLLRDSCFLKEKKIRIKLLSKVGDDSVGQQLIDELEESNVDTSSPLFCRGPPGSTTAFTTVIVSQEKDTRTCLHTPGTCGELTLEDVQSVDLDEVFKNVVHLHSDSRHTYASLLLAREAKSRGIMVSCDCEKDRKTKTLDELIQLADLLFTNSNYLGSYLERLNMELVAKTARKSLPSVVVKADGLDEDTINVYTKSLSSIAFFTRWYSQWEKQVVVTQGHRGALHYKPHSHSNYVSSDVVSNHIEVRMDNSSIHVEHRFSDNIDGEDRLLKTDYIVHQVGVLGGLQIVDTTGAGDAFIGGYLMAKLASEAEDPTQFALKFGSWVGGRKLEGPGARCALPKGADVDQALGNDEAAVKEELERILSSFNSMKELTSSQ